MADQEVTFRLNIEDDDLRRTFEALLQRLEETNSSLADVQSTSGDAFGVMAESASAANKEVADLTDNLDETKVTTKGTEKETKSYVETLDKMTEELKEANDQLEEENKNLEETARSSRSAASGTSGFATALRGVGTAIKRIGIAALIGFLVKLTATVKSASGVADSFSVVLAKIDAAFGVIADRVIKLGPIISGIFGRPLQETLELTKDAFAGIGEELKNETEIAGNLEKAFQRLREATLDFRLEQAKLRTQIEELRNIAIDANRPLTERVQALQKAIELENQLAAQEIALQTERVRLLTEANALGSSSLDDLEEQRNAEVRLAEIRGESAARQRRVLTQLVALQKQLSAEILAEQEAIERRNEAEGLRLGPLGSIDDLPDQIQLSKDTADAITDSFFDEYSKGIQKGFDRVQAERAKREQEEAKALEVLFQDIGVGVANSFDAVGALLFQGTQRAIEAQQLIISELSTSLSGIEGQLREQEQLRAEGFANNATALEQSLQRETAALETAKNKQLQLEERAAKQQLRFDTLQQASQLTLATAKLIASSASLGPFGIIAAATTGLAFIFSTIAKARSLAKQFSTAPGFKEGVASLDGPGSATSDSIPIWASKGERVVDASTNDLLGGGAVSNQELLQTYLIGKQNMNSLNSASNSLEQANALLADTIAKRRQENLIRGFGEQLALKNQELIAYWKSRPIDTPIGTAFDREYFEGATKIQKRYRVK